MKAATVCVKAGFHQSCFSWNLQFLDFLLSVGAVQTLDITCIVCTSVPPAAAAASRTPYPKAIADLCGLTWSILLHDTAPCYKQGRLQEVCPSSCWTWESPEDLLPFNITWEEHCCLCYYRDLQLILPRNEASFYFNWVICLLGKHFILCCMFQGLWLCHFHFI